MSVEDCVVPLPFGEEVLGVLEARFWPGRVPRLYLV